MEQSWVCAGGEEQIEIFTDSKGKSEKKILNPRERWCRRAPGLAPLLEEARRRRGRGGACLPVMVSLPLSRSGLGPDSRVLRTPGGAGWTTRVGCGQGPAVQDCPPCGSASLSRRIPKGSWPSTQHLRVCPCPVGLRGGSWQSHGGHAPVGVARWGPPSAACWQAAPVPVALSPFGWAGRALSRCPSPPGYRGPAHPTLGVRLPGDTRGFPPRASSQILP